ncbi:MAG: uroporphyrinogen decarboxylase family protein [Clostridiales bacterium]|nr:uroporphyrinogen decarboxylase family protein [Clostridiales bacterium]
MVHNNTMEKIKKIHIDSFNWKAQNIPFGIWVNDTTKYKKIMYDDPDFDKKLFERQMTVLEDTMKVGSDLVPVLGITNYGIGLIPSLFGATLINSSCDADRTEEMGFWVEKIFNRIEDIDNFCIPEIKSELLDCVIRHIEYYRDNKPADIYLSNSLDGPFSIAELLRGPDLYLDIYDKPEYVHKLMDMCTDVIIRCEKKLRKIAGYCENVDEFPTYFGIWAPCLRFGDDSIINLSEEMIREFVIPYYKKIAKSFGCKIEIHFCSVNKPIGEQVLKGFLDCDGVVGISTQLGTILYEKYLENIRGKLSIEAGYGDALKYHINQYGGIKNWMLKLKESFRRESGLILYTTAGSIEEGKRLLEEWNTVWSS